MPESESRVVENFLREVMKIERKFATDLKGYRSKRREELHALVEETAKKDLSDANR